MITTNARTSPAETGADGRARTTTSIAVSADDGRVRVRHRTSCVDDAPRIRAVLLASTHDHARISLVPEGALLLAGDDVHIEIRVGAGVRLELVEPAGTVAYAMRGGSARWRVDIAIEPGAALIWHGEPFVVAHGARVVREVHAVVEEGGTLALRETLALGRHGEPPGEVRQSLRAQRPDGTPLIVDGLTVSHGRPGLGLGDRRVLESILVLGPASEAMSLEPAAGAAMTLDRGGLLWRTLADEAHRAAEDDIWRAVASEALSC